MAEVHNLVDRLGHAAADRSHDLAAAESARDVAQAANRQIAQATADRATAAEPAQALSDIAAADNEVSWSNLLSSSSQGGSIGSGSSSSSSSSSDATGTSDSGPNDLLALIAADTQGDDPALAPVAVAGQALNGIAALGITPACLATCQPIASTQIRGSSLRRLDMQSKRSLASCHGPRSAYLSVSPPQINGRPRCNNDGNAASVRNVEAAALVAQPPSLAPVVLGRDFASSSLAISPLRPLF